MPTSEGDAAQLPRSRRGSRRAHGGATCAQCRGGPSGGDLPGGARPVLFIDRQQVSVALPGSITGGVTASGECAPPEHHTGGPGDQRGTDGGRGQGDTAGRQRGADRAGPHVLQGVPGRGAGRGRGRPSPGQLVAAAADSGLNGAVPDPGGVRVQARTGGGGQVAPVAPVVGVGAVVVEEPAPGGACLGAGCGRPSRGCRSSSRLGGRCWPVCTKRLAPRAGPRRPAAPRGSRGQLLGGCGGAIGMDPGPGRPPRPPRRFRQPPPANCRARYSPRYRALVRSRSKPAPAAAPIPPIAPA